MSKRHTRPSAATAALLPCCALLAAVPVSLPASEAGPDEVIVTARKREESLLDVPLAMTALSSDELETRRISSLADLATATPGLYFESFNAGSVATPIIRGLSQQNIGGFDQQVSNNVGSFIDGVYQTNRNGFVMDLLDIERVEVIKGPASALYGRATFSGAINIITKDPDEVPTGNVRFGLGSDEDYLIRGSYGGPIGDSGIRGRIAAGYNSFDGTIRNTEDPGDNLQGHRNVGVSGSLLIPIGDRLDLRLSSFYADQSVEHSGQYLQTELNCGTGVGGFTYYCGKADYREPVSISPEAFGAKTESSQTVADLTIHFDSFDVRTIAAYTESESELLFDADYTAGGALHPVCEGPGCSFAPAPVITRYQAAQAFNAGANENDDISLEIRIQSTGDSRLSWLGGLFFFDSSSEVSTSFGLDNTGLAPGEFYATALGGMTATDDPIRNAALVSRFESDVQTIAVFGSLEYEITDRLRASVEGRFEREEKDFNNIVNFFAPGPGRTSDDWTEFTPRVTVDYDLTDDTLIYLTAAKGHRAGGFNAVYPASVPSESRYDSETNWTYELGAKMSLLDQRLTLTTAVFHIDWSDMQITGASTDPLFPQSLIRNTGDATSQGFEVDLRFTPNESITTGIAYAFSDPEFDSGVIDRSAAFQCAPDICKLTAEGPDVGGNQLPRTVRHQLTADVGVTRPLNDRWDWTARVDYAWADDAYRDSINQLYYGERSLVGAWLAFESDQLTVAFWGKNLFDDQYVTYGAFQPRTFTARAVDYTQSDGRRYGITVSYDF
jgi:iron complex outermembrane receptor protein